jgi:hypothetical protein
MTTRELLAEYAGLLNQYGVDSQEANQFLEDHKLNPDFYELARLSNKLKRALTVPLCEDVGKHDYQQ